MNIYGLHDRVNASQLGHGRPFPKVLKGFRAIHRLAAHAAHAPVSGCSLASPTIRGHDWSSSDADKAASASERLKRRKRRPIVGGGGRGEGGKGVLRYAVPSSAGFGRRGGQKREMTACIESAGPRSRCDIVPLDSSTTAVPSLDDGERVWAQSFPISPAASTSVVLINLQQPRTWRTWRGRAVQLTTPSVRGSTARRRLAVPSAPFPLVGATGPAGDRPASKFKRLPASFQLR